MTIPFKKLKLDEYPNHDVFKCEFSPFTEEIALEWPSLKRHAITLFSCMYEDVFEVIPTNDIGYDVYAGIAGIAWLNLRLFQLTKETPKRMQYLNSAYKAIERIIEPISSRKKKRFPVPTFYTGRVGTYSVALLIYENVILMSEYTDIDLELVKQKREDMINRIKDLGLKIIENETENKEEIPDELLYGRSGYLYCCLLVNNYSSLRGSIPDCIINPIIDQIMNTGKTLGNNVGSTLMWKWHGKYYLGGAHGVAGIFYILLQFQYVLDNNDYMNSIHTSLLHFIAKSQQTDGQFSSSYGKERKSILTQFCHGSPGFLLMLPHAYQHFKDDQILESMKKASEHVREWGLLYKGNGFCHGINGNAFSLIKTFSLLHNDAGIQSANLNLNNNNNQQGEKSLKSNSLLNIFHLHHRSKSPNVSRSHTPPRPDSPTQSEASNSNNNNNNNNNNNPDVGSLSTMIKDNMHRGIQFLLFLCNSKMQSKIREPEEPHSLMNGYIATLYTLSEIISSNSIDEFIHNFTFPGWDYHFDDHIHQITLNKNTANNNL